MRSFVAEQIRKCPICIRTKTSRKPFGHTNLIRSNPPLQPFDTIAIDTFGPLAQSQAGNKYIIVIQCMFSRYVIITPVAVCNTDTVSKTLIHLFSEHGFPRVMLSDNGPTYSASMLQVLCMKLGIKQQYAPAYHPQSNGLVERFMSTLKSMLLSYMEQDHLSDVWDKHLPEFQLAYNSSIHASTGFTPFSLVHGREARLVGQVDFTPQDISSSTYRQTTDLYLSRARAIVQLANQRTQADNATSMNNSRHRPPFSVGSLVLVEAPHNSAKRKGKFARPYPDEVYVITRQVGSDRYDLQALKNHQVLTNIHASRLKPIPFNETSSS
ncbi:hypothetical protein O0I10_013165 [Lichtheimia ornata]|uniref:Integrase catalytic domain-containing protein n=1 Tax=Lichtheimia ornata TaxID=688661 RepID=A0AAD7XSH5_9FUNG|nr:uncharacterized protein O0I10_013165 [Lichtheimia ornata]KAJ8651338.1 hypothetical protein O0I10_013165 [Lichtheimia ornata]